MVGQTHYNFIHGTNLADVHVPRGIKRRPYSVSNSLSFISLVPFLAGIGIVRNLGMKKKEKKRNMTKKEMGKRKTHEKIELIKNGGGGGRGGKPEKMGKMKTGKCKGKLRN